MKTAKWRLLCYASLVTLFAGLNVAAVANGGFDDDVKASHALPKAGEAFWKKVDELARASARGADKLAAIWPADDLKSKPTKWPRYTTLIGGRYRLDNNVVITGSKLSATSSLNVDRAEISIDGVCVTRQDIEQHYPDLALKEVPHVPEASASWSAYGIWGSIHFIFDHGSLCLSRVMFEPTPKMSTAYPENPEDPEL